MIPSGAALEVLRCVYTQRAVNLDNMAVQARPSANAAERAASRRRKAAELRHRAARIAQLKASSGAGGLLAADTLGLLCVHAMEHTGTRDELLAALHRSSRDPEQQSLLLDLVRIDVCPHYV